MSDLNITAISIDDLRKMDLSNSEVSLKVDGSLLYYLDGDLISAKNMIRNNRFPHILKILKENNFPNCFGEIYIPNGNVLDVNSKRNWKKTFFMPISLIGNLSYSEKQKIIRDKINEVNNPLITQKIIFTDIETAYKYVVEHQSEGLVIVKNEKMMEKQYNFTTFTGITSKTHFLQTLYILNESACETCYTCERHIELIVIPNNFLLFHTLQTKTATPLSFRSTKCHLCGFAGKSSLKLFSPLSLCASWG